MLVSCFLSAQGSRAAARGVEERRRRKRRRRRRKRRRKNHAESEGICGTNRKEKLGKPAVAVGINWRTDSFLNLPAAVTDYVRTLPSPPSLPQLFL